MMEVQILYMDWGLVKMIKYYCDRCGKDITNEHYNALTLTEVPTTPNCGVDMDVYSTKCFCNYCMNEYKMLMNGFMQKKVQVHRNPMTKQFECKGEYFNKGVEMLSK